MRTRWGKHVTRGTPDKENQGEPEIDQDKRNTLKSITAALLAGAAATGSAKADNPSINQTSGWTQFQADNQNTGQKNTKTPVDNFNEEAVMSNSMTTQSTPVVDTDAGEVVLGTDSGDLFIYDLQTGTEKWSVDVGTPIRGGTPAITEDKIFVPRDVQGPTLVDRDSKSVEDSIDRGGGASSPLVIGDEVAFESESLGNIEIYDKNLNLQRTIGGFRRAGENTLSYHEDTGRIGFSTRDGVAIADFENADVLHKIGFPSNVDEGAAMAGDTYIATAGNKAYGIDIQGGTQEWSFNMGDKSITSPVVFDDEDLAIVSDFDGDIYGVESDTGAKDWQQSVDGPIGEAVAGKDTIVVTYGGNPGVAGIDKETGNIVFDEENMGFRPTAILNEELIGYNNDFNIKALSGDLRSVTRNSPPQAEYSTGSDTYEEGETVSFDGSLSDDVDGSIRSFEWDLDGDGVFEETGENPSTVFNDTGMKDVTLRVTDDDGATDTYTDSIEITSGNEAPEAAFDYSGELETGETVSFDGSLSTDPDNDQLTHEWDFGSATKTGETADYEFNSPGTYVVEHTVTDEHGATDTETETIRIQDGGNGSCVDLGNISEQYDDNGDCKISIGELGNAASDYTSNQLEISELAQVARDYARTV